MTTPMQQVATRMATVAGQMARLSPRGSTLTTRMELALTVEYRSEGDYLPARISGRPEHCDDGESPEVELLAVYVSTLKGKTVTRIDILPALSSAEEQALLDEAMDHAAEAEQDNHRASVEAAADAAEGR